MMSDLFANGYTPDRSFPARIRGRLTQWRVAAPLARSPKRPMVTFTFDDFPKSAATNGASIIESVGARATYYAASGLSGRTLQIGDLFGPADVRRLEAAGHEIGSHTQSHQDCARAPLDNCLADIELCDLDLMQMGLSKPAEQFAYPFGETTVELKRALANRYTCARGILPGINRKGSDRAQLRAIELGDDRSRIVRAITAIKQAVKKPGWVIFYTHDVRNSPSRYGVSPEVLKQVAKAARASGADILPMSAAFAVLHEPRE